MAKCEKCWDWGVVPVYKKYFCDRCYGEQKDCTKCAGIGYILRKSGEGKECECKGEDK